MEYKVIPSGSGNSIGAIDICHGQWTFRWNMTTYTRFKLSDPAVLFREVNAFWASKTIEEQYRAFLIYFKMYQILADPNNVLTINADLAGLRDGEGKGNQDIVKLYDRYVQLESELPKSTEEFDHGNLLQREFIKRLFTKLYEMFTEKDSVEIVSKMKIIYASTMTDTGENGQQYPDSGRTYMRSDYNALAALAIRLRPALPVFGQCMHVYQDKRKSGLKESAIVKQLEDTDIFNSEATVKLKEFMEASLKVFKYSIVTTVNGAIGESGLAYWCLAKAIYRRVACGEIDSTDGQSSIVTNIFNFIDNSVLESVKRNFGPVSRKKRPDESPGSKGEDNQSIIEGIKAKEEITRGRRRMINIYAHNPVLIAKRIDPTIPVELVQQCCFLTPDKLSRVPHEVQDGLVRWVLSAATPVHGDLNGSLGLHHNVDYLRREELWTYMGIAQAVLEHWGYYELAALMDAGVSLKEGVIPVSAMWAHDELDQQIMGNLVQLFPFEMSTGRRNTAFGDGNVGVRDIRDMTVLISTENWVVHSQRYIELIKRDRDGFVVFPPGFINRVAGLLIQCCSPKDHAVGLMIDIT